MPQIKNLRAVDQSAFDAENRKDFVVRKFGLSSRQFYELCLATLVVVISSIVIVYNDMVFGSALCFVVGVVLHVIGRQMETHKKVVRTKDFLNALFASALGADYNFCMIVKQDDAQIAYLDHSFQEMFPDMLPLPRRTLEMLFSKYAVSEAEQAPILQAVKQGVANQVSLQIQGGSERKNYAMLVSVDPIQRPAGFTLIRGKTKAA